MVQNGATSAVGRSVIQIAKARGLNTINIIRDRPNLAETEAALKAIGATHVVTEDFARTPAMRDIGMGVQWMKAARGSGIGPNSGIYVLCSGIAAPQAATGPQLCRRQEQHAATAPHGVCMPSGPHPHASITERWVTAGRAGCT